MTVVQIPDQDLIEVYETVGPYASDALLKGKDYGLAHNAGLCQVCAIASTCNGLRRLRDYGWCASFAPAVPAPGPAVPNLERRIVNLEEQITRTAAQLRGHLFALRDVEYLHAQSCPLDPSELETARATVAQDRADIAACKAELVEISATLDRRRKEVARVTCWETLCRERPGDLDRLLGAREEWRAAGFVLAEVQELPSSARLRTLGRYNDSRAAMINAATELRAQFPPLALCGDALLWDLPVPETGAQTVD